MRYMLPKISIYIKERNTVYLCYVNGVKFFVLARYETTYFQFYYYHRNSIVYRYSFDYITLEWISEFYTFLKNIGFFFSISFFFLYIHDSKRAFCCSLEWAIEKTIRIPGSIEKIGEKKKTEIFLL